MTDRALQPRTEYQNPGQRAQPDFICRDENGHASYDTLAEDHDHGPWSEAVLDEFLQHDHEASY